MIENISEIEVKLDTKKENFYELIDFEKDWERKFNSSKVVDALK